jgi:ribonuclease Z
VNLEAFVLGCAGMMPLPNRHLTSVLLRREGELFLFDCGEGTQVSLRRLNLKWKKISAIFISHTHADHITGLPGILMLSAQVERDEPLYIIGPPRVKEFVDFSRNILEMYINYDIVVKEIDNPAQARTVYEGDGFHIRSFPVRHSRTTVGYSLTEDPRTGIFHPRRAEELGVPRGPLWSVLQRGESVTLDDGRVVEPGDVLGAERRGRKVSYVTDTLPASHIAQEIAGSDLAFCEGMFDQSLADSAREKKHMTASDAGKLASKAGGVKKMGLLHYSPRYTDRDLKVLLEEAQAEFENAFLTRDRMAISVPYED